MKKGLTGTRSAFALAIGIVVPFAQARAASSVAYPFVFGPFPKTEQNDPAQAIRSSWNTIESDSKVRSILADGTRQLAFEQTVEGTQVRTTKYQDYLKGIEVLGSMALHHEGPQGIQVTHTLSSFDLDTTPRLSAPEALGLAKAVVGDRQLIAAPELKVLPREDGSAQLVYLVQLKSDGTQPGADVYLSANTGETIANISSHLDEDMALSTGHKHAPPKKTPPKKTPPSRGTLPPSRGSRTTPTSGGSTGGLAPISIYGANSQCQQLDQNGDPVNITMSSCTPMVINNQPQPGADLAAQQAYKNASTVLQYYAKVHNRNSYDNRGSQIISVVHAGSKFDNAFWDTQNDIMAYGDGDGVQFGPFVSALDVAGHEMTHGVTAATARLISMGETGALNEAYSDFFGKMIANDGDWAIGKGIFINKDNPGLRDLANPHNVTINIRGPNGQIVKRPYPATMAEEFKTAKACDQTNDRCFVHLNSTIPSHISYLTFQAIGAIPAQKLIYLTLTQYLTSTANFKAARDATLKACAQVLDQGSCQKVQEAWAQAGL